jgi:hypothetical protein
MASLIPAFMDDRTPPGERDVFNLLAAGPDDWVVLHSLDLAPWNRGLRTEIDFVVITPEAGILCVEVKSHEHLFFDGHRWSPATITRSPFKQAADGRFTFTRRLHELAPELRRVPVVHCCIFPRSNFDLPPNLSIQPWELMDMRAFRTFRSGMAFCADLKARIVRSIEADANLRPLEKKVSADQVANIVRHCVPVQTRRPEAREEILRRAEEMDRLLRDQQKPVLKLAALNKRVIVAGGAGTGKTLIAREVARRAAEGGARVGLLCFNQIVGDWLRRQSEAAEPPLPNLVVGRAIQVMAKLTGLVIPECPPDSFWENELPDNLEKRLTDSDFKVTAAFDYLVIDEAQDILARPRLWQCLLQFLNGGMYHGAFALFGDFSNQVLSDRAEMNKALAVITSTVVPSRWDLTENCRNYRIVGDTAVTLGGLGKFVYSGYMRAGGGLQNYNIFFYDTDNAQLEKLRELLKEFRLQGYKPSEITVLSFRSSENSAAERIKGAGFKMRPVWQNGEGIGFTSIQAFKGMENKVIILTDVLLGERDYHRDLFYTGLTRSTESVRVLCHKNSNSTLLAWLTVNEKVLPP